MKKNTYSRREFFKVAGAAGAAAIVNPPELSSAAGEDGVTRIPTRPFGATGVSVSCLSLGGMFDIPSNQLLLRQALKWGVTYWDTADCYEGGNSEAGIGTFFKRNPETRKQVFLVTKSDRRDPKGMTDLLDRSLKRMNTDYVDLILIHGIDRISEVQPETKEWAAKAKSAGKIKFFGFSAHSNMEELMLKAPTLGWIDGIMVTYNYRIMRSDKMKAALDACAKAGIGVTAMKTQGGGPVSVESETELELAGRFLKRGFTDAQAKLKAVWEESRIASICSQMPNMTILMSNVAAALDKTKLSATDIDLLEKHASQTSHGYCAGCTAICEGALAQKAPVGDILRYLMYYNSYGDAERARACFSTIPEDVRRDLARIDYTEAEKACPQGIRIGDLIKLATTALA